MPTIMVVDDAAFMRMRCKKLLTQNGYDVIEAATGAQAVETYKKSKPDAVLLDITMPDMDGLTALKEMKKLDPDVRVAMVSAMGQHSVVLDALKSVAKAFVVKPFAANRVLTTVKKLLE